MRLVRGHSGDDYVMIAGIVDGGEDEVAHQTELKGDKVRTDRQMIRAVTRNAKLIRATMPYYSACPAWRPRPFVSGSGCRGLDENMSFVKKGGAILLGA